MQHYFVRRWIALALLALILCTAAACSQADPADVVYILNGFESERELFSIRPAIKKMSGRIDIIDAQNGPVKSGKAMKFTFEKGIWPDLILHIRQTAHPDLDIAAIKTMGLVVFNDNTGAIPCQISLVTEGNSALLHQDFTLEPGVWNDLQFPLTGSFDPAQVVGFRVHIDAPDNSVFYFDEWSVTVQ